MEPLLRYRGREVGSDEVEVIRKLIADTPGVSRRGLSQKVCEAWGWTQANGASRDAVCRGLLLALHRAGHIVLPPARWVAKRAPDRRSPPASVDVPPISMAIPLRELGPVEIRQVRRTPEEALVKSLVAQHHYLGYVLRGVGIDA